MSTMTTGNISTLNFMLGANVDDSSLNTSMNRIQKALQDVDKEMTTGRQQERFRLTMESQKKRERDEEVRRGTEAIESLRAAEAERQAGIRRATAELQAQRAEAIRGIEAESAAEQRANAQWLTMQAARRNADPYARGPDMLENAADRIARQIAMEQEAADITERNNAERVAGIMQAVDAEMRVGQAREAQQRATQTQIDGVNNEMQRGLVRVMTTEQRINHEYSQRLIAIDAIEGATAEQTAHLRQQAAILRQQTMEVERQRGNLAGGAGFARIGSVFQEAGRGLEDFAIGFSMAKTNVEGIAMGLRGATNNVAQLASFGGPILGASVAIGASLTAVILPALLKWIYNTEEIEKREKKINDEYDRRLKLIDRIEEARNKSGKEAVDADAKANKDIRTLMDQQAGLREQLQLTKEPKQREKLTKAIAEKDRQIDEANEVGKMTMVQSRREKERSAKEEDAKHEDEFNKWVYDQSEQRRLKELKAMDEKFKFMEAAEKQFLDDQITSQTESIDILQERIQKAGNAAGPSAAFVTGTQAAESAINRAISGTRSVEDTMKAQLKVQQDMLKALNKQKNQLTTKAI